jgi:outer membrane protein assembly factor BamB
MAHALNAKTGAELWHSDPALNLANQLTIDTANNLLFIGGTGATFAAVDATNGTTVWQTAIGAPAISGASIFADGSVYFGGTDGQLYAINAQSGAIRWTYDSGYPEFKSLMFADGAVFLPAADADAGAYAFIAVDAATGQERWKKVSADNDDGYSPGSLFNDSILFGTSNGRLFSVSLKTGVTNWILTTGTYNSIGAGPSIVGDVAYFFAQDGSIYGVNATTGDVSWRVIIEGTMFHSPDIVDGVIYVGTNEGAIYALGDGGEPLPAVTPVNATAWQAFPPSPATPAGTPATPTT